MADNTPISQQANDPLIAASFATPEQKSDKKFGLSILRKIYSEQAGTSDMYFGGRAAKFHNLYTWALGRNTIKEFLDLMKIDGNHAYTGVDPTPNRQGPQFVETLVNSMAQNEEYPCVTAIDDKSKSDKVDRKQDALHRMYAGNNISEMEEHSGLMLEPPNAYVPEDELSAEVYFQLEDRLPVEIDLEQRVEKVMADNEYPSLKRRLYRDGIVVNTFCTKIGKLPNGYISIRKPSPANLIYNFFSSDSGKTELSYIGEVYSLKVRELRRLYGGSMDEKELFSICMTATRTNVANRFSYQWQDSFLYNLDRPYDDYSLRVFDCEIKLFDADYYVSKKDAYGKENIQQKKRIPKPTSEAATIIKKDKYTVYRGVWAIGADKMLYWGLPDIVIKPYQDISESLFSYTLCIPNNDGEYIPSLFERALSPLKRLSLIDFKIKQILANMAPPGYTIDVESIRDIEVNGKVLSWEQVISIRNQTGVVLWSSRGLNPTETNQRPPIEGLANAADAQQLQELREQKMECIQEIRSVLGVPLYRDGSDLAPRMGASVVENQTANANNVTDYITAGYHQCIQETLHKVCILKWDEMVLKEGKTQFIDTQFSLQVEMKSSDYERQLIEAQIVTWSKTIDGNGNPLLGPKDVFKIRQIKNYKMQDLYLSNMVEQNRKKAMDQAQQQSQYNAQAQQQSNAQQAQNAQQLAQQQHDMTVQIKDSESKNKKQESLLQGFLDILKGGGQIPAGLMPLFMATMQNVGVPLVVENHEMQQQIQAQMQQQMMAAMQPQAPTDQQQAPQAAPAPEEQQEMAA